MVLAVPTLPFPRGATSAGLFDALRRPPHELRGIAPGRRDGCGRADEDLQRARYVCYERHYRGFDGVDEGWEWEPSLLALRRALEAEFERALEGAAPPAAGGGRPAPAGAGASAPGPGGHGRGPARDRRRRRRAVAVALSRARRHPRAVPRVLRPPL